MAGVTECYNDSRCSTCTRGALDCIWLSSTARRRVPGAVVIYRDCKTTNGLLLRLGVVTDCPRYTTDRRRRQHMTETQLIMGLARYWEQLIRSERWKQPRPGTDERLLIGELLDKYGVRVLCEAMYQTIMAGRRKHREYTLQDMARAIERQDARANGGTV